jgi:ADP-heptose:LPS heptosyltransferase
VRRDAAPSERVLIIKLGALGDFVQAMGPVAAIRRHHADAEITLLTRPGLADLAEACPHVDRVWYDEQPGLLQPGAWLRLRQRLREAGFRRVYDLQTSDRSSQYFHLMAPGKRPEWSGIARFASHPHDNPARDRMHTLDRQADQLRAAGITDVLPADLSWAAADIGRLALDGPIVLLVPGGSAHRPEKRWPTPRYAALAQLIAARGVIPVVLGGEEEQPLGASIASSCAAARDLTGRTSLREIAGLGGRAVRAIGNDTGPMHLIVAAGSAATVLYSAASDPGLTAPRGRDVVVLRRERLEDLPLDEVAATLG